MPYFARASNNSRYVAYRLAARGVTVHLQLTSIPTTAQIPNKDSVQCIIFCNIHELFLIILLHI